MNLHGGRFYQRWHQADLARSDVSYVEQTGVLHASCAGPGKRGFRVAMNDEGALLLRLNGREVLQTSARAAIHAPGEHLAFEGRDRLRCLMVFFSADLVETALRRRFTRLPAYDTWATGFSLTSPTGSAFHSLSRWAAAEADRPGSLMLTAPAVADGVERSLLSLFVECLADHYPPETGRTPAIGEAEVRRIEEWIDEHFAYAVGVEEMAASIDVPVPAVLAAFRRLRECTPVQALIRRRLAAARTALQTPDAETTVTRVALECGFFHFGRFSVRYRQTFGEKPSETLDRARRSTVGRDRASRLIRPASDRRLAS